MTSLRKLGSSDLEVFPLALGGNVFGWTADQDTSFAVLDAYTAAGGNFIDTADSYSAWVDGNSGGESETVLGQWLAARGNRDDVVLATKVSQHPEYPGLSAANIKAAADASLRRLGTDHIDLYYTHFDKPEVPVEEIVGALDELVRAARSGTSPPPTSPPSGSPPPWTSPTVRASPGTWRSSPTTTWSRGTPTRAGYATSPSGPGWPPCPTTPSRPASSPASTGPVPPWTARARAVPPAPGDGAGPPGPRRPGRDRRGPRRPRRHGRPGLAGRTADGGRADRVRAHGGAAAGAARGGGTDSVGGRGPAADAGLGLRTRRRPPAGRGR